MQDNNPVTVIISYLKAIRCIVYCSLMVTHGEHDKIVELDICCCLPAQPLEKAACCAFKDTQN